MEWKDFCEILKKILFCTWCCPNRNIPEDDIDINRPLVNNYLVNTDLRAPDLERGEVIPTHNSEANSIKSEFSNDARNSPKNKTTQINILKESPIKSNLSVSDTEKNKI